MRRKGSAGIPAQDRPFLTRVWTPEASVDPKAFPFTIPALSGGLDLGFDAKIAFIVGENGSGKSTLLEALAAACGFNPEGGNRNHAYRSHTGISPLVDKIKLSWTRKVAEGFFLRAESFYNFASVIDELGAADGYGGKSLHAQSHGEAFLSLFVHRFRQGLFILDEPEAALSPQRQLTLLRLLRQLETAGRSQFLIATHSPILLSYPGAAIYSLDGERIRRIGAEETEHVRLTRDFLNSPDRYFRHLFDREALSRMAEPEKLRRTFSGLVVVQAFQPESSISHLASNTTPHLQASLLAPWRLCVLAFNFRCLKLSDPLRSSAIPLSPAAPPVRS